VDNFGRRPLSWAARRGHSNVVKLLRRSYEDNGIASHDEDVSIATTPAANHESTGYCDICTLWIQDIDIHYHCGICNNGNFDVCRECIASGAFCFDQSHKLVKRTVKENTLVEVLEALVRNIQKMSNHVNPDHGQHGNMTSALPRLYPHYQTLLA
jgi:ankyrin repeat protein